MKFFKITAVLIIFLTSSCEFLTPKLWKKSQYIDRIDNFLITEDGKNIVFIGNKYHYIFSDQSGEMKAILDWKDRANLKMKVGDFEKKFDNITGKVQLIISSNRVYDDNEEFVRNLGFQKENRKDFYEKILNLEGKIYLPEKDVDYSVVGRLNREYTIRVSHNSISNTAYKIAKTPVTIVNDTVTIVVVSSVGVVYVATLLSFASILAPFYLINYGIEGISNN